MANYRYRRETGRTRRKSGRIWRRALFTIVLVAVGAAAVIGGKRFYDKIQHEKEVSQVLDTGSIYHGISVEGVSVGGMTIGQAENALKGKEKEADGNYEITITYGSKEWKLTEKDLSFQYDTADVLKKAYEFGRSGDREQRFQTVKALKTNPKNFSLTATPEAESLKPKLEEIAAQIGKKATEPAVVSFNFQTKSFGYREGEKGISVNSGEFYQKVKDLVEGSRVGTVPVPVSKVNFKNSLAQIKKHMGKLSEFSTTSTNNADGTYNMSRALRAAGGASVASGATFSFFGRVGPCDQAHGYRPAGAILNGILVQDYGGGICQASTTLYGAVLRAGMTIVERTNHSIPSSYCPIGQDATVSYPALDFKFRNPTPFPAYIVTRAEGRKLTAEMYGYRPDDYDEIRITSQVKETIPAPEEPKYVLDKSLPAGTVKQAARARKGYRAVAQRVFYKNGKIVKTEKLPSSYYKPQAACYTYAEGTDPGKGKKAA